MRRRRLPLAVLLAGLLHAPAAGLTEGEWLGVEYGALLDRALPTHSGASVGEVLDRLDGRGLPPPGERREDDLAHRVLDPLLETYAFVLADALDIVAPPPDPPMAEIGGLWVPGEAEPAWVELLRARRYLVESDGRGRMRAFLPWPDGEGPAAPDGAIPTGSAQAAREAWETAWPVLRHVVAAERRRLAAGGGKAPLLRVEARAYRHRPARSTFDLGLNPHTVSLGDDMPSSGRPPFDLEAFRQLLARRGRIEGARLDPAGEIVWFTSDAATAPSLLGRPMTLADAAVAYRAVFHGGLAEPYMSLDRGRTPWIAAVNFGGRLRDTAIGLVSLLCDVRFKTISLGLDPFTGEDVRSRLARDAEGFRSHLDRFAAHPDSGTVLGQQTRFWFYPDGVELTLSPQGDVFALRSARMTAASERVDAAVSTPAPEREPPWTQEAVAFVNRRFEALARVYPEMADLDEAARLLATFAWLRAARDGGLAIPDLDALLDVELPAEPTPRRFPHLLTYDTLPPPGSVVPVGVRDATPVGEALERLQPRGERSLPADRRCRRALAALDPRAPDQTDLVREIQEALAAGAPEETLAALAYRGERIVMHRLVLQSAPEEARLAVERRRDSGEAVRVLSVGIGGIDLGMGSALARAPRRVIGLAVAGASLLRPAAARAATPSGAVSSRPIASAAAPGSRMRDHGLPAGGQAIRHRAHTMRLGGVGEAGGSGPRWRLETYRDGAPDARSRRRVERPGAGGPLFERVEEGRHLRFRFDHEGRKLRASLASTSAGLDDGELPDSPAAASPSPLPAGLALLEVVNPPSGAAPDATEPASMRLRVVGPEGRDVVADVPRAAVRRLVVGHALDPVPDRPLPALGAPEALLGGARGLLVLLDPVQDLVPWAGSRPSVAGEEDPARIAEALAAWWSGSGTPRAVAVATSRAASPARWAVPLDATRRQAVVVPDDAFPGSRGAWRARALALLPRGETEAGKRGVGLVVVVSAEAPGVLAERLRRLAGDPAMSGKALAVVALSSGLRPDLPAALLGEGKLAAVGLLDGGPVGAEAQLTRVARFLVALRASPKGSRIEGVPGPFVWFY